MYLQADQPSLYFCHVLLEILFLAPKKKMLCYCVLDMHHPHAWILRTELQGWEKKKVLVVKPSILSGA